MGEVTVTGGAEFNISFLLFLLLLLLIPLFVFFLGHIKLSLWKASTLPPGPYPWPVIGNILDMGKKPHISLAHFAKIHGPVISLRLGTQLLVVGSSPAAAAEILKTHDALLSARHVPQVSPMKDPKLNHLSLAWAFTCSKQWKLLRNLCRAELFSSKAIESQVNLREKKVKEMLCFLGRKEGKIVKIGEVVLAAVFNILGNLFLSKDLVSLDDETSNEGIKGLIWRLMELATTPNLADFYPILDWLDIQGLRKTTLETIGKLQDIWEGLIEERRVSNDYGVRRPQDFLDVLIGHGFQDNQISNLLLELFLAGTETTSTTVEWAMVELLKNQEAMKKLNEELARKMNGNDIREFDLPQLSYLSVCIKETLRLHPPTPFLLPHKALETCTVMNYTIPKDSQIFVNLWAIGRDPEVWDDPLAFKPERFMNSELDFKGNDFEFTPFGAGRRICPGLSMGSKQLHLILASLFHSFEWYLSDDTDPMQLDTKEKFGLTLQKEQPLLLIPKSKV